MAYSIRLLVPVLVTLTVQQPLSAQDNSLPRVMQRGKTMYLFDRAAWLTSDNLAVRLPVDRRPEVGGWIVTPGARGVHVDYFGKDAMSERVVYAADVKDDTVTNATVFPTAAEPALIAPALQMVRALRAARSEMSRHSDWRPCTNAPFNTIVLPPDKDGTVPVYFLTPQTETGSYPFGGHYEVDIRADGSTAYTRSFTRSCITLAKPAPSNGAVPAGLFITHVLDAHPTEIHVFEQYYAGLPVFVATGPTSVWKVENGNVEVVSPDAIR